MTPLDIITWGAGESVVLVHGSLIDGPATWAHQRPLAERWCLRVVQRRGFGSSPRADGEDFEHDAEDLCDLLAEPAHLVAHSYGAIGALLAAARRPRAVRSLTLVEPTSVTAGMDEPEVAQAIGSISDWWLHAPRDPAKFLVDYSALLGVRVPRSDDGPAGLREAAHYLRHCRPPWTAEIPWVDVAEAGIPTLVISGAHTPALDAVADAVARRTGGAHIVISSSGHAVQRSARNFNRALEDHLLAARSRSLSARRANGGGASR
ncbi:MAG TPA: alpha/beta hydrolase [Solirubrobacteraceae bacterium]|nr:alpha/beta hydrolase [Solirubrobacteraceae bacterium]